MTVIAAPDDESSQRLEAALARLTEAALRYWSEGEPSDVASLLEAAEHYGQTWHRDKYPDYL